MSWTQEHMITGSLRVEWELHINREADIEIHESHGRFALFHVDQPYDPPSYTPEQMDALVAWWTARRSAEEETADPAVLARRLALRDALDRVEQYNLGDVPDPFAQHQTAVARGIASKIRDLHQATYGR